MGFDDSTFVGDIVGFIVGEVDGFFVGVEWVSTTAFLLGTWKISM
jgi:hypothetical protein